MGWAPASAQQNGCALRYGIDPVGRPLLIMPSQNPLLRNQLSAEDLGAIIAYVKSVPPVDYVPAPSEVGPLGRVLFVAG
ncbi:MAG: hypothetical protein U0Z44_06695 [Kouleothrix sp.]